MPALRIAERRVGDVTFLTLAGRLILDEGEAPLREKIDALIRQNRVDVVVDLHDVTYIDSCGVGALVAKCVSLRKAGGDMIVLHPSDRSHHTLEIAGLLGRVFEECDSVDAALSQFASRHRTSA
jgi:anti-sigma B factor antagonist